MNQNPKEELLMLWMDDALSPAQRREFEPFLKAHPEWEAEREEFLRLRENLRAALPSEVEPPYPDFFNSHLLRRIREEESRDGVREPAAAKGVWGWLQPWLMPAAAAAVVMAFVVGKEIGGPKGAGTARTRTMVTPAVYSSIATVDVRTWRDEATGDTVIVLDGLDEIPSSVDLQKTTADVGDADPGAGVF